MKRSPISSPFSTRSPIDGGRRRALVAFFAVLALAPLAGPARGNGRFPSARFMTFGPGTGSTSIGLQTTFGYVFSRDGGRSWQLRCEEALGFDPTEPWDPALVLTGTRAIAGLPLGLSSAAGDYCQFDRAASVPDEPVVDLASDPSAERVVAALGPIGAAQSLMLSDDGGLTWRRGWSRSDFFILTVDIAPGRPERLYVSGLLTGAGGITGALFRSDDGGATFVETTRSFGPGAYVYLSAVDPRNADVVYARVDLATGTALSRSDDGGATFRELRRSQNRMTGFAISADGRTLWSGSPGELPGDGIHESIDSGATWRPRSGGHVVLCLRHHDGILYLCTPPEMNRGIALACSSDGGERWNPVLAWSELAGPESCPAGSPGRDLCEPGWLALRSRLVPDGGTPPPGPRGCIAAPSTPDDDAAAAPAAAPASPDAGVPDAPAGTTAATPDTRPPDRAPATTPSSGPRPASGCDCSIGRAANQSPAPELPLLIVVLALTWRKALSLRKNSRQRPR
jgi:hypothetical protein